MKKFVELMTSSGFLYSAVSSEEIPQNVNVLLLQFIDSTEGLLYESCALLIQSNPDLVFELYEKYPAVKRQIELLLTPDVKKNWYEDLFKDKINKFLSLYQKTNPVAAAKILEISLTATSLPEAVLQKILADFGEKDHIKEDVLTQLVVPILVQLCRKSLKDPKPLKEHLALICKHDKKVILVIEKQKLGLEPGRELSILDEVQIYLQNIIDDIVHYPIGFEEQSTQSY